MNQADEQLIARVKRLEAQNRVWKLGGLAVLLAFGLSLAAGLGRNKISRTRKPLPRRMALSISYCETLRATKWANGS